VYGFEETVAATNPAEAACATPLGFENVKEVGVTEATK